MYRPIVKTPEDIKERQDTYELSEKERKKRNKDHQPALGSLDVDINQAEELIKKGDPKGTKLFEDTMKRKKAYYTGQPFNKR